MLWLGFSEVENKFHCEVSARVVDAHAPCLNVDVGIFQAAQVVLVGSVEQVVHTHEELGNFSLLQENVC